MAMSTVLKKLKTDLKKEVGKGLRFNSTPSINLKNQSIDAEFLNSMEYTILNLDTMILNPGSYIKTGTNISSLSLEVRRTSERAIAEVYRMRNAGLITYKTLVNLFDGFVSNARTVDYKTEIPHWQNVLCRIKPVSDIEHEVNPVEIVSDMPIASHPWVKECVKFIFQPGIILERLTPAPRSGSRFNKKVFTTTPIDVSAFTTGIMKVAQALHVEVNNARDNGLRIAVDDGTVNHYSRRISDGLVDYTDTTRPYLIMCVFTLLNSARRDNPELFTQFKRGML